MRSFKLRIGLRKSDFPIFFMLLNAFLWYYLTLEIVTDISQNLALQSLEFLSLHSLGIIIGGVLGLSFYKRRLELLFVWTFSGIVSSISVLLPVAQPHFYLISFVWGLSFGLGMPSCLGYFAETIAVEDRGFFGGLVFLCSFLGVILITGVTQLINLFFLDISFIVWRLLGIIPLLTLYQEKRLFNPKTIPNEYSISSLVDRRILLYLVPWFMFNTIDKLEELLLRNLVKSGFSENYALLQLMSLLFLSIFTFVGGLLSDTVGRKPVVISGFSAIGIAYAMISVFPEALLAWYFFFICDGLAWGLLLATFVALIWGDISLTGQEEKYYFVGNLPLFLSTILQLLIFPYVESNGGTIAFSLAAFFLFLAVIPILFAEETLPEKKLKAKRLRRYVEKAKKMKERYK